MVTVRLDGITAGILSYINGGKTLKISGWSTKYRNPKEGEDILVVSTTGQESRYKIEKMSRPSNVKDQYFMTATFNPREG